MMSVFGNECVDMFAFMIKEYALIVLIRFQTSSLVVDLFFYRSIVI
jgi:hypothetical protein